MKNSGCELSHSIIINVISVVRSWCIQKEKGKKRHGREDIKLRIGPRRAEDRGQDNASGRVVAQIYIYRS